MCVIAGYTGSRRAAPILIEMLKKVEYFDGGLATGIATIHEGKLYSVKIVGNVDDLVKNTDAMNFPGTCGIIHTRPAGGRASHAHPFVDESGEFAFCENGTYLGKTVIIAAGAKHRRLGLEREEEFIGNGISFCAVCDGAFYTGQHVALIGGGNTALQEAILLSENCAHVTVVQNLPFLTGEAKLVHALKERNNVSCLFSTVVTAYEGDTDLRKIRVQNTDTGAEAELEVDGLFLAIGTEPENQPYESVAELNHQGYIVADESCRTGKDGIFVAGDCRTKTYRQVATAIADGATAALNACRYLDH